LSIEIPKDVLDALHECGKSDDEIAQMPGQTMFQVYCEWSGLTRNWSADIWVIVTRLKIMEMDREFSKWNSTFKRPSPE